MKGHSMLLSRSWQDHLDQIQYSWSQTLPCPFWFYGAMKIHLPRLMGQLVNSSHRYLLDCQMWTSFYWKESDIVRMTTDRTWSMRSCSHGWPIFQLHKMITNCIYIQLIPSSIELIGDGIVISWLYRNVFLKMEKKTEIVCPRHVHSWVRVVRTLMPCSLFLHVYHSAHYY